MQFYRLQKAVNLAAEKGLTDFLQKTNALNVLDVNGIPLRISEKEWSHLSDQTIQSIQNINLQNYQVFYAIQKQIADQLAVATN